MNDNKLERRGVPMLLVKTGDLRNLEMKSVNQKRTSVKICSFSVTAPIYY